MKLCLNMIVKNESARIERCLKSVAQYIDCYAITDTGSTDDTIEKIKAFFKLHGIPGVIGYAPFKNWSQARNAALLNARSCQKRFGWDWALLMDADMCLVMNNLPAFEKALDEATGFNGRSMDMEQRAGALHWGNRRLISSRATGVYRGVTHEYLDVDAWGLIDPSIAFFDDKSDGANRTDKFKRDIKLLLEGLEAEPYNGRYYFYLAQSYREDGDIENAKLWYKKRVDFGGWEEERWNAQLCYAHCFKKDDEARFVHEMLIAYKMRPTRAETLFDLAHHFRHKDGWQSVAAMFAEVGMDIPRPDDLLFVNDFAYKAGLKEEFAITGFYNETKRGKAFKVCSDLSLEPGPYESARESARFNLYFYLKTLAEDCPSFKWQKIKFDPPADWVALNPSVTNFGPDNRLFCNVRCVNYRIDDEGRYLIRGTDGTANNSNPINTRNFLLDLGEDPFDRPVSQRELLNPPMPCEFPPVIGLEDLRIFPGFPAEGQLYGSATVRQIHFDGVPEQCVVRINEDGTLVGLRRMLRTPRECEKNWAPIVGLRDRRWMWRPGTTINENGEFVNNNPPPITTDIVSGGSQVIRVGDFWLSLVHTARQIPGASRRYYFHRWAVYNAEFKLMGLSRPFVLHEKEIEFVAGLAPHPTDRNLLVISYGFKDCEARVATVTVQDVMRMIWAPSK